MTPFEEIRKNKSIARNSGSVVLVRSYTRTKPKVVCKGERNTKLPPISTNSRRGPSRMDVASFKTIVNIQKENMKITKELNKNNPDPVQASHKKQWSLFMKTAAKASRKTKRKMNASRRAVKVAEEEKLKNQWLSLFRKIELYEGQPTEAEKQLYKNWPRPLPDSFSKEAHRLYDEWRKSLLR